MFRLQRIARATPCVPPPRHLQYGRALLHNRTKRLRIGSVSAPVLSPVNPELVPVAYDTHMDQHSLAHLRWLMQKAELGQDIFLMGPPGPTRRRLVLWWCQLTGREVEYLALSRDTTDSDLKQRREIVEGDAIYEDQPPVLAAMHGRVLLLDGIEKVRQAVRLVIISR
jgi:hypothetical protein